ncbi:hypothetical protein PGB90_010417 [Kerria lacca]
MENIAPLSDEEAEKLCTSQHESTKDFIMQQTMYRIKDPRKSLKFYNEVLGMTLLVKLDFPSMKFSIYFMGYEDPSQIPKNDHDARTVWALSKKGTIELTHNWGTENNPNFSYHCGNAEPRGFGHIGLMVPDVEAACKRFEEFNVEFIKRPNDGKMKGIAFIKRSRWLLDRNINQQAS